MLIFDITPFFLYFFSFASVMTPAVTEDFISFETFPVDPFETIQVKRYKSAKTGLTAIHADVEGNKLINQISKD